MANLQSHAINRELLREAEESQYELMAEYEMVRMKGVIAYIAVRGSHNITEQSDVPPDRMKLAMKVLKPVLDQRVYKTKWVVLRWPTSSMAQMAGMSTEAFEDFFFSSVHLGLLENGSRHETVGGSHERYRSGPNHWPGDRFEL